MSLYCDWAIKFTWYNQKLKKNSDIIILTSVVGKHPKILII